MTDIKERFTFKISDRGLDIISHVDKPPVGIHLHPTDALMLLDILKAEEIFARILSCRIFFLSTDRFFIPLEYLPK